MARLVPGTGWILAALTTWQMSMLCMWEGRHCRRRPERLLWRAAWRMSGTISRSEIRWILSVSDHTPDLFKIQGPLHCFILKYWPMIWALLASTGVNAVLRHGCWSHASSLHRTATSLHWEVWNPNPQTFSLDSLCQLFVHMHFMQSDATCPFKGVLIQWRWQACWRWVWATFLSIRTGGGTCKIPRTLMKNSSGRWRSLWWL